MAGDVNNFVVIMAGGLGSRFWPASREARPKQFLDIAGSGMSLLQSSFARACKIVDKSRVLIISNARYKDEILVQIKGLSEDQLLLEPSRNNTGPSVAYTALHLRARNEKAVFAILPSDHIIEKESAFVENINLAFSIARRSKAIVTLGIQPTRPDTGYGYIHYEKSQKDAFSQVISFVEKPDLQTAQTYLSSGDYLWNAGIFVWSVETVISCFSLHMPAILEVLEAEKENFGTPNEAAYVSKIYPNTPKISVDYAILEKASNIFTIPSDIGWSDLGTWNSLYEFVDKDDHFNVVNAGEHLMEESSGNIVVVSNKKKLVVLNGLKDFIVIDEDDVLLICPRDREQEIKNLRKKLYDSLYT